MEPLSVVYWSRVGLGFVAASLCAALNLNGLLPGVSFGMLFYFLTYYIYRLLLTAKVDKPSKLLTEGIFAYFLTWIVSWVLLFTLLNLHF